jgi:VIT family protein
MRVMLRPRERHRAGRVGWLRAVVLGANDGILSTASLVIGVAAAHATHGNVFVAGVAGLVASDSGRIGIGWQFRRRGGHAPPGYSHNPAACFGNFIVVPGASGRVGCARWGRRRDAGRNARHVLGCSRFLTA